MTRRICLISQSAIADDPRVRRQGDAFLAAGYDVVGVGLPGGRSSKPRWRIVTGNEGTTSAACDAVGPSRQPQRREWPKGIRESQAIALALSAARGFLPLLSRQAGLRKYWRSNPARLLYDKSAGIDADVWVANDWNTLPVAARLARERGGFYTYDTHELALSEYDERLAWRLFHKPTVQAVESTFIGGAKVVSCVSSGISEQLQRSHGLSHAPLVIRNLPTYQSVEERAAGAGCKVLYHGIVAPTRGLEAVIESVPLWRAEFSLSIRGPADAEYRARLQGLIEDLGLRQRVQLVPPVAMTDLVQAAAQSHVGIFALPGHSKQNQFALPNKLFEYIMAGLAVCVSRLPEMAAIVEAYQVGVTMDGEDRASIARAINGLTPQSIAGFRAAALAAARELNWEVEAKKMLAAYDDAARAHGAPAVTSVPLQTEVTESRP